MTTPLPSLPANTRDPSRPGLGLIGAGAFGSFCLPHLRPFFRIRLADPRPDLPEIADWVWPDAGDAVGRVAGGGSTGGDNE